MTEFEKEVTRLLNHHSQESVSDTPDFILAVFLTDCLTAWNDATVRREMWYGRRVGDGKELLEVKAQKAALAEGV